MNRKAEKGASTRQHILDVATQLFAKGGYEASSIEKVLEACGISRGALYHHFSSKEALFEAVLEAQEARIAQATIVASRGIADPVDALLAGCHAWLGMSRDDVIRRIVLLDAPVAVGWEKWRQIDARHGFGLLKNSLTRVAKAGHLAEDMVDTGAHMLLAVAIELALLIARAEDPIGAERTACAAFDAVVTGWLGTPR